MLAPALLLAALAADPFVLTVRDAETGRGVPLVELRTVHDVKYVTDSAGVVAIDDEELLGREVFLYVKSHGYRFPADGFGFRGKAVAMKAGSKADLKIERLNVAERLYRVTGGGIYRDSVRAGLKVPLSKPLLAGDVFGCDTVFTAKYRGKLFWAWGDTNRPSYPLGNFQASAALSELPPKGLAPGVGVDFDYFTDKAGFAREMAKMPGEGLTWITGLVPLPEDGEERLFATYVKVKAPLAVTGRGLAVFDDKKKVFTHEAKFDRDMPAAPEGQPFVHEGHVYFARPYPLVRVKASAASLRKAGDYEAFTCLEEGGSLDRPRVLRDGDGRPDYAWRRGTPATTPAAEAKLRAAGAIKEGEGLFRLRDRDTGKAVRPHRGSVQWNAHRNRWVLIATQEGGASALGEVWYAEADTPTGPWAWAVKVVTHDKYSFYNPAQHPYFAEEGGRKIYFEGTYTVTFSGNTEPTPRYEYNQVMYRLDLDSPKLSVPVPVVAPGSKRPAFYSPQDDGSVLFYAPERPGPGTVPVVADKGAYRVGKAGDKAVFYARPPGADGEGLYECVDARGGRSYVVGDEPAPKGTTKAERPICRVWKR